MDARRTYREGFTTVELLIVMAIVGLLATLTIPMVLQFAGSPNRSVTQGARDLYMVLKAAKIYATTNNVETAVVYTPAVRNDGDTGAPRDVFDRYAVARWLPSQGVFVPLANEDGAFHEFANGACLWSARVVPTPDQTDDSKYKQIEWFSGNLTDLGMEPQLVQIYFPDSGESASFPAHVFTTGGEIRTYDKQRISLMMGLAPDSEPDEWGQEIDLRDENDEIIGTAKIHARVELYTAQGRVKISS